MTATSQDPFAGERPAAESHFAWLRTRMAAERNVMAYARFAITVAGIGFALYGYLAANGAMRTTVLQRGASPQWLALSLILAGIVLLFTGALDYRAFLKDMRASEYATVMAGERLTRTGLPTAIGLLFIAETFAFLAVLFQL